MDDSNSQTLLVDLAVATLEKRASQVEKLKAAKKAGTHKYLMIRDKISKRNFLSSHVYVNCRFFHLDDENFRLAVFEQLNGRVNCDVNRLSCLKLNPLLSEIHTNLSLCKDIDPDSNMFSELGNCEYYVEEQFNDLLQKRKIDNNRSSFMHVNARSLQCNLNGLTNLLATVNLRFSFIGITETWLQDSHVIPIFLVIDLFIKIAITHLAEVLVSI